jgi:hypothetical protein
MDNQIALINSILSTSWKPIWSLLYPLPGLPSNSATGCLIMHEIGYLIKSNPYTEEGVLRGLGHGLHLCLTIAWNWV